MFDEEEEEVEEGAPAWMATFSDMATLLLTFFILLLSFANMDVVEFKVALGSVKEAFGVQFDTAGDFEARAMSAVELSERPSSRQLGKNKYELDELQDLKDYIRKKNMSHRVQVLGSEVGIILRVKDVALFETGSDRLNEHAVEVLNLVADLFDRTSSVLSVEGHTDNVPITRQRFPSNWELSAARAAAVMKNFVYVREKSGDRLAISGYGALRPIADNETASGRTLNRRVEFIFRRSLSRAGPMFNLKSPGSAEQNQAISASTPSEETTSSPE
ncbi:MAG: OmpA family protein [Polyangiaceae bacterium]|nr:OmpA family protein [Polyangiaceae bacterium]